MKKIIAGVALFALFFTTAQAASWHKFKDKDNIPGFAGYAIGKLVDRGILKGNDDGTFMPERAVNRAEFCKILSTATGVDMFVPLEPSFPDVQVDDWFFPYVETAKKEGWVKGYPDGTFRPGNKINRAEVSKVLVRAFGFDAPEEMHDEAWFDRYVRVMRNKKLLPHGVMQHFFGEKYPTRAEISEQIFRFMKNTGKFSPYDLEDEPASTGETEESSEAPASSSESTTVPQTYEYSEEAVFEDEISVSAGKLSVAKKTSSKASVDPGQKDVVALRLNVSASQGPVEVSAFQFRRVGNGSYADFSKGWIEMNNLRISPIVNFTDDLIQIELNTPIELNSGQTKEAVFRVDLSNSAESGNSSRFVLFLPQWVGADTESKIGLFPIGGSDLEVK